MHFNLDQFLAITKAMAELTNLSGGFDLCYLEEKKFEYNEVVFLKWKSIFYLNIIIDLCTSQVGL